MAVYSCEQPTFNGDGTLSCSQWVEVSSMPIFPPISMSDANDLIVAVGILWAIAFGFRFVARFIEHRSFG